MKVDFHHRSVVSKEGEFVVVQEGAKHRTVADEEAEVILFEPAINRDTGNITN